MAELGSHTFHQALVEGAIWRDRRQAAAPDFSKHKPADNVSRVSFKLHAGYNTNGPTYFKKAKPFKLFRLIPERQCLYAQIGKYYSVCGTGGGGSHNALGVLL